MKEDNLVNWDLINTYLGDDKDFQKQMIQVFISNMPEYYDDLESAFNNKDLEAIGKQAHKMKSSLSMMGIEAAHNLAVELENQSKQNVEVASLEKQIIDLENILSSAIEELKKAL